MSKTEAAGHIPLLTFYLKDVRALQMFTSLVHQTFSKGSICPPHVKSKIKLYGHQSYQRMTTGQNYKKLDRNKDSSGDIDTF